MYWKPHLQGDCWIAEPYRGKHFIHCKLGLIATEFGNSGRGVSWYTDTKLILNVLLPIYFLFDLTVSQPVCFTEPDLKANPKTNIPLILDITTFVNETCLTFPKVWSEFWVRFVHMHVKFAHNTLNWLSLSASLASGRQPFGQPQQSLIGLWPVITPPKLIKVPDDVPAILFQSAYRVEMEGKFKFQLAIQFPSPLMILPGWSERNHPETFPRLSAHRPVQPRNCLCPSVLLAVPRTLRWTY